MDHQPASQPAYLPASLDEHQLSVIRDTSQCLLVRACAGSGKSTTLAHRCKAFVDSGIPPDQILVLTFSTASRDDLASKIQKLGGLQMPQVVTHHAFALKLIRQLPGPHAKDRVVEAHLQRKILRECLPTGEEPGRQAFKRALTMIAKAKACGVASMRKGSPEFGLLTAYNAALRRRNLIDFDDMISLATVTIESAQGAYEPTHTHLLLDEAQDTSEAQMGLLQAMAPPRHMSFTAVGDSDQTIYSFRGSRPDMLSRIAAHWQCRELTLPTNYRCGPGIVSASLSVIGCAPPHLTPPHPTSPAYLSLLPAPSHANPLLSGLPNSLSYILKSGCCRTLTGSTSCSRWRAS